MPLPARCCRFVMAADKMVCTNCVCSGAQGAMQAGNIGGMSSMAQCSQICHCEAPTGPWRPEREARGSALGVQSQQHSAGSQGTPGEYGNFTRRGVEDTAPYKACASGVHATKPTACKALTERRYRRNRFVPFIDALYQSMVRRGACPSPTMARAKRPYEPDKCSIFIIA